MEHSDEQRLIEFTRKLISTPSLSKDEAAISEVIAEEMRSLGYDKVWTDDLHNVVGVLEGVEPGLSLMFNGHIDHAGVGGMETPFSADIRDGEPYDFTGDVIYGRGACDMKAAVAAMVHAGGAVRKAGLPRKGRVIVTCVAREEMARGEGIKALLDAGVTADMAVSGEASGLDVYVGHRGKYECKVTTKGRTTHGGNPADGINAIFKMTHFLQALQSGEYTLPDHDFLGRATITALDIEASPGALTPIVPDLCSVVVDRRFLPEESEADLLAGFHELFARLHAEDPEFQAEVETLKWFPAMFTRPEEPVVQAMLRAREKVLGRKGEIGAWYFGVDGTFLNEAGIPTVGLGPGNEYLAHTPKDVVPVAQVIDAAKIYSAIIADLHG